MNGKYPYSQKIVSQGGGTGQFSLLRGLVELNKPDLNTAVAGNWDSGGRSGELRIEEGVLPPGDYSQCLLGLMEDEEQLQEAILILRDRQEGSPLFHTIAAKAEKAHHSVGGGIDGIRKLFRISGKVLSVSLTDTDLHCETKNGTRLNREHELDDLEKDPQFYQKDEIENIFLEPKPKANPRVLTAILEADKIIFPPGSPYGSIFPHLLIDGVAETILQSPGKLILVLNLMSTEGQDNHLKTASKWLSLFQYYLGDKEWIKKTSKSRIDYLVVNDNHIDPEILEIYKRNGQELIEIDEEKCREIAPGLQIIRKTIAEYLKNAHLLRHNPTKLAQVILEI